MKCVLILEDEPLIAMDLTFACEDADLDVVVASTSDRALAALDEGTAIDGAILDVNLGGGDTCHAVARRLRELCLPFVLNTGDLNRDGELLRGMAAPIITKPSESADVVALLIEAANAAGNEPPP